MTESIQRDPPASISPRPSTSPWHPLRVPILRNLLIAVWLRTTHSLRGVSTKRARFSPPIPKQSIKSHPDSKIGRSHRFSESHLDWQPNRCVSQRLPFDTAGSV